MSLPFRQTLLHSNYIKLDAAPVKLGRVTYSHSQLPGFSTQKGGVSRNSCLCQIHSRFSFESQTFLLKYLRRLLRQFEFHELSSCTCLLRSAFQADLDLRSNGNKRALLSEAQ
jgi:hypothetical protein